MVSEDQVIGKLKEVSDPEVPVDVYNFGLIYGINVEDEGVVGIQMTLTSESCPSARQIPDDVKKKVEQLEGVDRCDVEVVWEPRWSVEKISAEGRETLGLDEEE